jgi:DNA primase
MNFVEAVKDLAQQYGMQVPEDDASPAGPRPRREAAGKAGHADRRAGEGRRGLPQAPEGLAARRGVPQKPGLSGEIAKQFGLGYAPEGWRSLASVFPSYDDPLLAESGLVIVNEDEDSTRASATTASATA